MIAETENAKVTNVLIDISIQLFTQLNSTQLLLKLLSTTLERRDSTKRRRVFVDCSNKRRGRLLEVLTVCGNAPLRLFHIFH